MKAKWILITLILTASVVLSGSLLTGCANCSKSCATGELSPNVVLPKGFVALKGLGDSDYDKEGWPMYIMSCKDGSVMTMIPETRYVMGSSGREVNEMPTHQVSVGRYYIDLYEVNNVQFSKFADAVNLGRVWKDDPCLANEHLSTETPACWVARNWSPACDPCLKANACKQSGCEQLDVNYFKEYWTPRVNDNNPARAVSFWEAWNYCRWVGKDLPTEAEWELAAKGTRDQLYPWGNIEPDSQHLLCNYDGGRPTEDGFHYTAPVSALAAGRSPYGCYNMAGNVWEWCKNQYDATSYSVTDFANSHRKQKAEAAREFVDPSGPVYGDLRVIRGGSYTSEIAKCRTTVREAAPANFHGMNIGFRGVLRIR
ncbi:MAG: SUMF1/EgtB/PvdO family nonheme iron enzyme [Phycisphaerae bacterium]